MTGSRSNVLIASAITADEIQDYDTASSFYHSAVGVLLEELTKETNPARKERLKGRIKDMLHRAADLQPYLTKNNPGKKHQKSRNSQEACDLDNTAMSSATSQIDNSDEINEKEWSFKLDLNFHIRNKTKWPVEEEEQDLSPMRKVLSLIPMRKVLRSLIGRWFKIFLG